MPPNALTLQVMRGVRALRLERGIEIKVLAKQLGTGVSYYRRMENGTANTQVKTILRIARILNVTLAALKRRGEQP